MNCTNTECHLRSFQRVVGQVEKSDVNTENSFFFLMLAKRAFFFPWNILCSSCKKKKWKNGTKILRYISNADRKCRQ